MDRPYLSSSGGTETIFSLDIAMNIRFRIAALLIIGLSLSAFVTPAVAAGPVNKLLIAPGEPYGLPKFGFSSSTINGFGQRIESVRPGGRAARLGLEPGDVILSLNGYRLTYSGSWNDALSQALYDGGYVQLRVRDVRTGLIRVRETRIDFGGGPIEHHFKTGVSVGPHIGITTGGIHVTR
jgi:membrane-associated protease RseP (regulator of RpoE activity)